MIVGIRRLIALGFLFIGLFAGGICALWGFGALPIWYATAGGVIAGVEEEHAKTLVLPGDLTRHIVRVRLADEASLFTFRAPLSFDAGRLSESLKADDPVIIIYRLSGDVLCGTDDDSGRASSAQAARGTLREIWRVGCDLLVGGPHAIVRLTAGGQDFVSYLDTAAPDLLVFLFLLWIFIVFARLGIRGLSGNNHTDVSVN